MHAGSDTSLVAPGSRHDQQEEWEEDEMEFES